MLDPLAAATMQKCYCSETLKLQIAAPRLQRGHNTPVMTPQHPSRRMKDLSSCFASVRVSEAVRAGTQQGRCSRPFIEGSTLQCPLKDSETLVLYTHTLCPYACRAWLALLEKVRPVDGCIALPGICDPWQTTACASMQGVDFQPVQIDLSNKPSWYSRRVNSTGLVPALCTCGRVITESIDICRWVDSNLEGPSLVPKDAARRRHMEMLIDAASRISSAGFSLLAGRHARHACL